MTVLKPCPCGETADNDCVHIQLIYTIKTDKETYQVMCENCDQETDDYESKENAIEAWNKKVQPNSCAKLRGET